MIQRHNGIEPDTDGAFVFYDDHLSAIAQAVEAERERCRRIVERHFGRDTMKSLECTSEIENAIRARTTS